MSIHFISGKPGAGKSLLGTQYIFDELVYGERHVVTNLPLKLGELNEYYQKNYDTDNLLVRYRVPWFLTWLWWVLPDWLAFRCTPVALCELEERIKKPRADDICSRVTIITDDQMPVFFTIRPGCEIEHFDNREWKMGKRPDYSVVNDSGVFYCLDEVHIAFNARAWADTGAEVIYYLSQHRKLGDDVICITQSVANVDKQFRSVAQDYTYVRNLGKEKWGLVRMPVRFIRKTYAQPPTTDMSKPLDWGIYSLDVAGLASCYDTAKGVGIHGRSGADKRERKKGIHWLWPAIGVPVLLIVVFHYLPRWLGHKLAPTILPVVKKAVPPGGQPVAFNAHSSATVRTDPEKEPPRSVPGEYRSAPPVETNTENAVTCVGWSWSGEKNYKVFLSDGETYDSADGEVDWIKKRSVSVHGVVYKILIPQISYTPSPPPQPFILPSPVPGPVNQADVTVIGTRNTTLARPLLPSSGQDFRGSELSP